MKKKITILAINEDASAFYKNELDKIFENNYEIDYRNLEMDPILPVVNSDLILYTDPAILNELISIIKVNAPTLMMKRTIRRETLYKIKEIPSGERVLLANINEYMANDTVALLYQLGVTDIEIIPYYYKDQFVENLEEIKYIINVEPKKIDFLPDIDAEILIIGHRVYDISNILDIISFLPLDPKISDEIIKKYIHKVPTSWYGVQYTWKNRSILSSQMNTILDNLDAGVIVINDVDIVEIVNKKMLEILKLSRDEIIDNSISKLGINNDDLKSIFSREEVENELINYQGKDLIITIKNVKYDDDYQGKVFIVNPYFEVIELQQKIHKKIIGKGYYSKYTFDKMIGQDYNFLEVKKICKKIAPTDSKILLLGETGVGKEVFAGSIHNESRRHMNPFIAINCATIPDTLLESILFGYEEGAFTGANKGGKIGLFERAHKGTIFLDEIGDLPLQLQARLLRVLEEGELMRLGGDEIISVDVRVISATNMDLQQLVEQGKFREDLYYRLNVFQITIPPLRDRSKDIKHFILDYLKNDGHRFITEDFRTFCLNYSWNGNLRELKNVIEYMTTISDSVLSFDNLPLHLKVKENYVNNKYDGSILLLKLIYYLNISGGSTGRRTLHYAFSKLFYEISENEIRALISNLSEKEMIEVNKGREGNIVLPKGVSYLEGNGYIDNSIKAEFLSKLRDL
ncbi:MAG: sigma 54-interacting transcriptional regulator [Tissierella sp.]|nr:sigma 54-interacting transcriptional regulator [Tissierella sp.]